MRVHSDAMLPPGADVVLAQGGSSEVADVLGGAVDHLDPDKPVESLDMTMAELLGKFYAATEANPERVLAVSRAIDEAFA